MTDTTIQEEKLQAQLDELKAKIDVLKARGKGLTAETKENFLEVLEGLETQKKNIELQLDELSEASEEGADKIRSLAASALDELNQAIDKADRKFSQ